MTYARCDDATWKTYFEYCVASKQSDYLLVRVTCHQQQDGLWDWLYWTGQRQGERERGEGRWGEVGGGEAERHWFPLTQNPADESE